ncbi:MAG: hypothetical protein JOZ96_23000 [Acidobacteria bacterium]|nr:hypothetical protein [Acidobacteriota bacterium]
MQNIEAPSVTAGLSCVRPLALRYLFPELRLKVQFVHGLNQAADVVTKHLAQFFVDLRGARLTTERVAELRFNHVKGALQEVSDSKRDFDEFYNRACASAYTDLQIKIRPLKAGSAGIPARQRAPAR